MFESVWTNSTAERHNSGSTGLDSGTDLRLETHNVGDLHITRTRHTTRVLTAVTAQAEMTRNTCQCAADAACAGGVSKSSTSLPSFARLTDTRHLITLAIPAECHISNSWHADKAAPLFILLSCYIHHETGPVWAESLAMTRKIDMSSAGE